MPIERIDAMISLAPLGIGTEIGGSWSPSSAERRAAWEMYVELITRISVPELRPEEGLTREALLSLYSIFGTTRSILRHHGPDVAKLRRGENTSFGHLAVAILNEVLRPFLAKWHPLLLDWESRRSPDVSALGHESAWEHHAELREELKNIREVLAQYALLLAKAARVSPLRGQGEG
jgi:hypothetical protein